MAETIADKAYVNTSVDAINQRILGRYQDGMGTPVTATSNVRPERKGQFSGE